MHGTTLSQHSHAMLATPMSAPPGVRPFDEGGGKSPVPVFGANCRGRAGR